MDRPKLWRRNRRFLPGKQILETRAGFFRVVVIVLAGLSLTLPAIIFGLPLNSHDTVIHANWYTNFSAQFWAGDLYPRWLSGMNVGLGSPAFFYYHPLPYYITGLLRPLFAFSEDVHGLHQLGASAALALIASGLSAYLWLKKITDERAALIAAILYMAMPYHLAVDLYVRSAFTEFWAFVWMPLILYFVGEIRAGNKRAVIGLALSYAALITTHLPTTLIFSPIPICYAFLIAKEKRKLPALALTLSAMLLGTGLSAVYLLPAMTTQGYVRIYQMYTGYYNNFLFKGLGATDITLDLQRIYFNTTLSLQWIVLIMAGLCACVCIVLRSTQNRIRREEWFWIVTIVATLFMMTRLSNKLIWQPISALQMIQFPWRYNAVLCVAVAPLLASALHLIEQPNHQPHTKAVKIAFVLVVSWLPIAGFTAWMAYPFTHHIEGKMEYAGRRFQQQRDTSEYSPVWTEDIGEGEEGRAQQLDAVGQKMGRAGHEMNKVKIVEGAGEASVESWRPGNIVLQVKSANGVLLNVGQFYYPTWTAHLRDGHYVKLTTQPSTPDGFLSLAVPGGSHHVELYSSRSPQQQAGQVISAGSLLILLCLAIKFRRARRWTN